MKQHWKAVQKRERLRHSSQSSAPLDDHNTSKEPVENKSYHQYQKHGELLCVETGSGPSSYLMLSVLLLNLSWRFEEQYLEPLTIALEFQPGWISKLYEANSLVFTSQYRSAFQLALESVMKHAPGSKLWIIDRCSDVAASCKRMVRDRDILTESSENDGTSVSSKHVPETFHDMNMDFVSVDTWDLHSTSLAVHFLFQLRNLSNRPGGNEMVLRTFYSDDWADEDGEPRVRDEDICHRVGVLVPQRALL